jgi:hypothetical protein
LILEGQGQARSHLKFNNHWSPEWGPVHSQLGPGPTTNHNKKIDSGY